MMAWIDAHLDAHSGQVFIYHRPRARWFMLVNRSIEYVAQSTYRTCEHLNGAASLRICLADQNATFSGVRMNKKLTDSFFEMCFEAVLEQKRGYSLA
jgi:hypothetical protein